MRTKVDMRKEVERRKEYVDVDAHVSDFITLIVAALMVLPFVYFSFFYDYPHEYLFVLEFFGFFFIYLVLLIVATNLLVERSAVKSVEKEDPQTAEVLRSEYILCDYSVEDNGTIRDIVFMRKVMLLLQSPFALLRLRLAASTYWTWCGAFFLFAFTAGLAYSIYDKKHSLEVALRNQKQVVYDKDAAVTISVGDVNHTLIYVGAGEFDMGATPEQQLTGNNAANATPVHHVRMSAYWIGQTEVTRALWFAVMKGCNRSDVRDPDYPINGVSFDEAVEFTERLNQLIEPDGFVFRLPTEAEWEYAARGGNRSCHYRYSGSDDIDDVANYRSWLSDSRHANPPKPVCRYKPNELGIFDMTGNVEEWCLDGFYTYWPGDSINPYAEPAKGSTTRMARGGYYELHASDCPIAVRRAHDKTWGIGLRIVLAQPIDSIVAARKHREYVNKLDCPTRKAQPKKDDSIENIIISRIHYPDKAEYIGMAGTVTVQFDISETGWAENVKAIAFKQHAPNLYSEATAQQKAEAKNALMRAAEHGISNMPDWDAAREDGYDIRSKWTVDITFQYIDGKCRVSVGPFISVEL